MNVFSLVNWNSDSKWVALCLWLKNIRFSLTLFEVTKLWVNTMELRGEAVVKEVLKMRCRKKEWAYERTW